VQLVFDDNVGGIDAVSAAVMRTRALDTNLCLMGCIMRKKDLRILDVAGNGRVTKGFLRSNSSVMQNPSIYADVKSKQLFPSFSIFN
jgi:hypothetical protein